MYIKTPQKYIVENKIIQKIGEYAKEYGEKVLIVATQKGVERFGAKIEESFRQNQLETVSFVFQGYPTLQTAKEIAELAQKERVTSLVALGGGRVIDVVKVASNDSKLPLIVVPTIAATCASWASVSIVYNQKGEFVQPYFNEKSPEVTLVDPEVILSAPPRFLYAGIIDTIAKYIEIAPYLEKTKVDTILQSVVAIAKEGVEILKHHGNKAIQQAEEGKFEESAKAVIDAIILQAGLTGSLESGKLYQGLGHPFYDASTFVKKSNQLLHGERVGFGLLVQKVLQKVTAKEWEETLKLFQLFDNVFTLEDLYLNEKDVRSISHFIWENRREQVLNLQLAQSAEEIEQGIFQTNEKIKEWRGRNV
ncbi:glycerol dehydrogenase [Pilibacter termitis]|uniref:Glycerol dehydrogenase n=1 Tax=Pilibacter termitis TaxID=263852 RepID=A0A1T4QE84_9ENTE|nr:iron-containing alcohol dehydrogenase family protein [Pilibacter termitis]SKA01548.1 glycerol dehydrogenase [Pilibacter termitis]